MFFYWKLPLQMVLNFGGHFKSLTDQQTTFAIFRRIFIHNSWIEWNHIKVNKAVIQARVLSGTYRTLLACNWTRNVKGFWLLPLCGGLDAGSIEHLLLFCPALIDTPRMMMRLTYEVSKETGYCPTPTGVYWCSSCWTAPLWALVANKCQQYGNELKSRPSNISMNRCSTSGATQNMWGKWTWWHFHSSV